MFLSGYSDSSLEEWKSIAKETKKILISESKTPITWVKEILILDGRNDKLSSSILLCSQMWKFRNDAIQSSAMQEIMEASRNETAYLVWYSSEQIRERPIENHQHRAFAVSQQLRAENIDVAWKIYNAHNRVKEHKRDMTISPSVLMFYIKRWFSITNIYIPTRKTFEAYSAWDKTKTYPKYSLNRDQQNTIYQIIRLFLSNDDLKLPFFVEVKKSESEKPNSYNSSDLTWAMQIYFKELARVSREAFPENDWHLVLDGSFRRDVEDFLKIKRWLFSRLRK